MLGRGVRGEGKPSPRRSSRDEVHLKVSPVFHAKPSILDPIRAIFDDLVPSRHFGRDLDLQDQARDWPGGPGPAHTFCFSPPTEKKHICFIFGGGSATPPA